MGKKTKELPPNPYLFIKSIAEQGYSLSTAIADLIDSSITAGAKRVELLFDLKEIPLKVYIADNGNGMSEEELENNMTFPSKDPETDRESKDLGRFGLGMKTASFSQTRKFTVITKKKNTKFSARTWDVEHLKNGRWEVIIEDQKSINQILSNFKKLSKNFLNHDENFIIKTLILWEGLYKYETKAVADKEIAIISEIDEELRDHLGLVFHQFIENTRHNLSIRLNNDFIPAFNPFPPERDLRSLKRAVKHYNKEIISLQGFILPSRSIKESKEGKSIWTIRKRSLTDMEGIYVYRLGRLIISGGWNRLVKKGPQFQLGRLKIEIGNNADALFQLNVSKSSIKTPFEIKQAFLRIIAEIKVESFKEYKQRINYILNEPTKGTGIIKLINSKTTGKGPEYFIDSEYPLYDELRNSLKKDQLKILNDLIKKLNSFINDISSVDEIALEQNQTDDQEYSDDSRFYINLYKSRGLSKGLILEKLKSIFYGKLSTELLKKLIDKT